MARESCKSIRLDRDGKILDAMLNRPETLNAINKDMDNEVARFVYAVAADRETKYIQSTKASVNIGVRQLASSMMDANAA